MSEKNESFLQLGSCPVLSTQEFNQKMKQESKPQIAGSETKKESNEDDANMESHELEEGGPDAVLSTGGKNVDPSVKAQDLREGDEEDNAEENSVSRRISRDCLPPSQEKKIARAVSTRRRSTVIGPEDSGAYLLYDEKESLWCCIWSENNLDDAHAFLKPKAKVPTYKYKKQEKMKFSGTKRNKVGDFPEAMCSFAKLATDYRGEITLIGGDPDFEDKKMKIVGCQPDGTLVEWDQIDKFYETEKLVGLGVVPIDSFCFNVKRMELPAFLTKANEEGYGIRLVHII